MPELRDQTTTRFTPGPPPPAPIEAVPEHPTAEQQADLIEVRSPEGRPGDPTVRGQAMLVWLLLGVGAILVGAIIVGASKGLAAGVVVLVMGLGLGIFVNTEAWAAIFRAKERDKLDHESDGQTKHPTP